MSGPIPEELDRRVLASGLDHPEGVLWDGRRGCLWAGGEAGQLYRVELDGTVEVVTTIAGGQLLGLALDADGRLYLCDPGNHQVWRAHEDGRVEAFGEAIDYPNYPAFGPDGTLYVSDSGSFEEATGRLIALSRDGSARDASPRPLAYANGLALDGDTLWVVESAAPGVSALDLRRGTLERVIALERCQPDGLALDAEGALLISCYQPNQIWRWTRDGRLDLLLDDWSGEYVLSPTNVAFYGDRLDRLAVASLCGTNLVTLRPPVPGAALPLADQPEVQQ